MRARTCIRRYVSRSVEASAQGRCAIIIQDFNTAVPVRPIQWPSAQKRTAFDYPLKLPSCDAPSFANPSPYKNLLIRLVPHLSPRHRHPHIPLKALPIRPQVFRRLFVQRIRSIRLQEEKLSVITHHQHHRSPHPLSHLSPDPPPRPSENKTPKKRTCNPTITAFRFKTGFQSSLRIFKHTFPSRSMLGW